MIQDPKSFESFIHELRDFVRTRLVPHEARVAAEDEVPAQVVAEMAAYGLFGYSIPAAYGGAGMTTEELVMAAMELSQCSVAFRARVGTNTGIGSEALVADGSDEQKRRYLPDLASGKLTGCFALTEPDAGSDATALRTTAVRDGDHYVLNGTKCFITNAPIAGLFTVMARTATDNRGAGGVSAFLVERGMPGLSTGKDGAGRVTSFRGPLRQLPGTGGQSDRQGRSGLQNCHEGAEQAAPASCRTVHWSRYPHAQ